MIHFNLADIRCQVQKLEEETARPDFWNDSETSSKTLQKIKNLKDKDEAFSNLNEIADEIELLIELGNEEEELSYLKDAKDLFEKLKKDTNTMNLETLLSFLNPVRNNRLDLRFVLCLGILKVLL